MILVSSCLAGQACRYNGSSALVEEIETLIQNKEAMMMCPELLGGFYTPREPAEIIKGTGIDVINGSARVVELSGKDVTDVYIDGAYKALSIAKEVKATIIVLKENSPSCGSEKIYNGTFSGARIIGEGVTTALLRKHGFIVMSESQFAAKMYSEQL
ncbi:DUF523 domain-containing protein [Priestia aryabhattai]|uniref:DUF523 domain-containing protein n=1 Tax=Priestia aryabhattai TaxID=412384 RepID=UPI00399F58F7